MALKSYYNTGTASVDNGSAAVTGQGTAWSTVGIKAGDFFIGNDGRLVPIASVDSDTALTLIKNWPGTTQAGAAYQIVEASAGARIIATTQALLEKLSGGNVTAFSGLVGAADKVPYFTGAGAMALSDFKSPLRTLGGAADMAALRTAAGLGSAAQEAFESASWTPGISFGGASVGIAYGNQTGHFIRVGQCVFAFGRVQLSNKGSSSGATRVTGLPYGVQTLSTTAVSGRYSNMSGLSGLTGYGSATDILLTTGGAVNASFVTEANFTNTSDLYVSIVYRGSV